MHTPSVIWEIVAFGSKDDYSIGIKLFWRLRKGYNTETNCCIYKSSSINDTVSPQSRHSYPLLFSKLESYTILAWFSVYRQLCSKQDTSHLVILSYYSWHTHTRAHTYLSLLKLHLLPVCIWNCTGACDNCSYVYCFIMCTPGKLITNQDFVSWACAI